MISVTTAEMHDILKMENNKEYENIMTNGSDSEIFEFLLNYISNSKEYELDEFRG